MDEFAQTRGVDDLFDDEIIPVAPSQVEVEYTEDIAPYEVLETELHTPTPPQDTTSADRGAGQYRRRGNGRGRGPRGGTYTRGTKPARTGNRDNNKQDEGGEPSTTKNNAESGENQPVKDQSPVGAAEAAEGNEGDRQDAESKELAKPKVPAVRGDRSGTGGVKKPKLTEEELSERMAAVKIAAAKRAAAHARAEADEASFHERERVAAVKRIQERQNHRAMVGERERNRQRKLQAQTGREWDAEKSEDTFGDRQRGGTYRRGMHGGVVTTAGEKSRTEDLALDGDDADFGDRWHRGRGGRGGGRGGRGRGQGRGGRGRGGNRFGDSGPPKELFPSDTHKSPPPIAAEEEFPALPGGNKEKKETDTSAVNTAQPSIEASLDTPISPMPLQGSWADHEDELHEAQAAKKAAQPA